jgi:hypothetical protein
VTLNNVEFYLNSMKLNGVFSREKKTKCQMNDCLSEIIFHFKYDIFPNLKFFFECKTADNGIFSTKTVWQQYLRNHTNRIS